MKKISVFFLLFVCLFCFCACATDPVLGTPDLSVDMNPRKITLQNEQDLPQIIKTIEPAVVGISASNSSSESVGSGVAICPGGYILTNHHVIDNAKNIVVYFANKTHTNATLVWQDPSVDIAIIKATVDMPYLEVESLDSVEVGEEVLAIGTPLTLQFKHTVTKGIVSALDRTIEIGNNNGTISYLQNLIQHDASINPGNSGGPLVNRKGKVIGINTLKVSEAEGIGFAIPIDVASTVSQKICDNGLYVTPYVGVYGFDADVAQFFGRTFEEEGVYLLNVDQKGPSGLAGLKVNDVIKKIDEYQIKTMLDLRTIIYKYEIGETVSVTFTRGGVEKVTQMTLTKK